MLFFEYSFLFAFLAVIAMVRAFSEFLAEHGVHLIYCPLPESGTIYPELFPGEAREALAVPSFLDRLVAESRTQGVHVVDLRPIFRANKSHPTSTSQTIRTGTRAGSRWPLERLPKWFAVSTRVASRQSRPNDRNNAD
jgi:hypothetical protein